MAGRNGTNLKVEGLRKYFPVRKGFFQRVSGWVKAVDGVDFEIPQGKTLGLVGESGCGKSTVARLVLKLLEPDLGRIIFQGRDIGPLSSSEMRPLRRRMQIVFQDPYGSLNPRMTVGQSIEEGLRTVGISPRARKDRVLGLLEMVGLPAEAADRYPHEFSGGQRQRVGIARALSVEPSLVICDEPVSALDVSIQAQVINLLNDLQERFGLSYLFIAHDLNVVGYMSDRVAVMYLGKIMEYAPAEILFENPAHPYTRALLAAAPDPDPVTGKGLAVLSGEVPSPLDPPPGCRFQGRCPLVEDRCRKEDISMYVLAPGHEVRCWKAAREE
ncbi:MAG: ABC transporter ATP-binding protein [Deltaproteobacteria bacterium]|nr:ABC transporter ATP-binding protein [Deltaproteobacteria bacterium]MBW1923209.1 ABC transporter ATP-binding protein [Deltaproteobacteria bacterium]MBW1948294.1 ABC transporter ATP-binding protein [Deltaproteobacteria bacterium]MBW2006791.1 ABC transporter ATP-binding protein [Deltaproteobacteria bacterium]MBW2347792.1 ABC transporter ATP-binding protein [Deltaproteobacteria bacterium]